MCMGSGEGTAAMSEKHTRWMALAVLIVAGVLAYSSSFRGAFVFDDIQAIRDNVHIRTLWPLSEAVSAPLWGQHATVGDCRPVFSLSLALNHALLGPEPWGYHLVNLIIHIANALLLFGIVRRTASRKQPASNTGSERASTTSHISRFIGPTGLALSVTLLWLLHPLQTQAVTYMVQRVESLGSFFYLLTLYWAMRGFDATPRHQRRWFTASVLAVVLGAGTKEIIVSAPLIVFLYDALFVSRSHVTAARRHWGLYLGLALCWVFVAFARLIVVPEILAKDLLEISPLQNLSIQAGVILKYLHLAVWPHPLTLDYGWPIVRQISAHLPEMAAVAALVGLTAWGLVKRSWPGFCGAWFFLILAPTSSLAPMTQPLVQHRMYLPLAGLLVLSLVVVRGILDRAVGRGRRHRYLAGIAFAALMLAAATVLGSLTHGRNRDYHDPLALWTENVAERPQSYIAHSEVGYQLARLGRYGEAFQHYREALRLFPEFDLVYYNWGNDLLDLGRFEESAARSRRALELNPEFKGVHYNLGTALRQLERLDEAVHHLREALEEEPGDVKTLNNLGLALRQQGRAPDAAECFRQAIAFDPTAVFPHFNLGLVLADMSRAEGAAAEFREAIRLDPQYGPAHLYLGLALRAGGDPKGAEPHFRRAMELTPPLDRPAVSAAILERTGADP